jgi:hypothetical protein
MKLDCAIRVVQDMTDCPCEECVCLAVCIDKRFYNLVEDCITVRKLLYYEDSGTRTRAFSRHLVQIKNVLKPHRWYCTVGGNGYANIYEGIDRRPR